MTTFIGDKERNCAYRSSTCMCSFSFSLSNSTYLGPFIVVLDGVQYRPAAPQHDMTPRIIWLGTCFSVTTTYFLSKRLPNGHLVQTAPFSESPMTVTSGTIPSLFRHHWSQVWLSWRTVGLRSTLCAETSRNSAGTCCCTF